VISYTALPPGTYIFRAQGATSRGPWSEPGIGLQLQILPPFWATWWFRAALALLSLSAVWWAHQLRLGQLATQFDLVLEERISERTRIARELHDTLLQSFQGLMLRFQAINEVLPEGRAKEQLERTLQRADQAIVEGRDAVYDLRSSTTVVNELAEAVKAVGNDLATGDSPAFRLVVEGRARDLHPIIRDEVCRITREALRNAFSHARANHIETEITYGKRELSLRIRDDGKGISQEIVAEGRAGHYGLGGMRERAQRIGAKLEIWSGLETGTEIGLNIPAAIAYGKSRRRFGRSLFHGKDGLEE
jgi:signal transduction histidine kinase